MHICKDHTLEQIQEENAGNKDATPACPHGRRDHSLSSPRRSQRCRKAAPSSRRRGGLPQLHSVLSSQSQPNSQSMKWTISDDSSVAFSALTIVRPHLYSRTCRHPEKPIPTSSLPSQPCARIHVPSLHPRVPTSPSLGSHTVALCRALMSRSSSGPSTRRRVSEPHALKKMILKIVVKYT